MVYNQNQMRITTHCCAILTLSHQHTLSQLPVTAILREEINWELKTCRPGRYGKESRLLLVAFPSASPIGGERSDVSTPYSYVVWRHAGTAAGHTPYTQTRTGPAGRSSVVSSLSHTHSHAVLQWHAAGTVYAGVIGSKWRSSVLWFAADSDCKPIVYSVKSLVLNDKRFNHTKVWCTFIFIDLQAS